MTLSLKERLKNTANAKRLEIIPVNISNVNSFFTKASKSFRFAKYSIEGYKDMFDYDNDIFTNFYDSLRMACLSLLTLYGYKTKTAGGHHYLTLTFGPEILIEELSKLNNDKIDIPKIDMAIKRAQKTSSSRSSALYDPVDDIISRTDLKTFCSDIELILKYTGMVIDKNIAKF